MAGTDEAGHALLLGDEPAVNGLPMRAVVSDRL